MSIPVSKSLLEELSKLWLAGKTNAEIARHFKRSYSTVSLWASLAREQGFLPDKHAKAGITHDKKTSKDKLLDIAITKDERTVLDLLHKKSHSLGELSYALDRSKPTIENIIKSLAKKHFDVQLGKDSKQVVLEREPIRDFTPINLGTFYHRHIKFGVVSDPHCGSKYQQMTLLHTGYSEFERQKVDFVLNAGDVVDGYFKMHPGMETEQFIHGADEQAKYVIDCYPKSKNFNTHIIGGSHDDSYRKAAGFNILKWICDDRTDLCYRGSAGATFDVGELRVEMVHPSGGVPYALSYRPQKIAENISGYLLSLGRERQDLAKLPHILVCGHWHAPPVWVDDYQGMLIMSTACFQAQTPYLRMKGLSPRIGFTIWDVWLDRNNNLIKSIPQRFHWTHLAKVHDF